VDDVAGHVLDYVRIVGPILCRVLLEHCSARMETIMNQPKGQSPKVTRK